MMAASAAYCYLGEAAAMMLIKISGDVVAVLVAAAVVFAVIIAVVGDFRGLATPEKVV